jgi:hypothetical protein
LFHPLDVRPFWVLCWLRDILDGRNFAASHALDLRDDSFVEVCVVVSIALDFVAAMLANKHCSEVPSVLTDHGFDLHLVSILRLMPR